ncbi:hypothetical protein [Burkholderia gladioli]|uniref:hypothetical protein n=1 Tax=Burkholderia gladioli TaxID=28095 RepID=UPI00163E6A62|nr:hypothetical protein [Burkholderia gladioli]
MTPFDYLGRLLDWAYAKHWAFGFAVALLVVALAVAAAAALDQDRSHSTPPADAGAITPRAASTPTA